MRTRLMNFVFVKLLFLSGTLAPCVTIAAGSSSGSSSTSVSVGSKSSTPTTPPRTTQTQKGEEAVAAASVDATADANILVNNNETQDDDSEEGTEVEESEDVIETEEEQENEKVDSPLIDEEADDEQEEEEEDNDDKPPSPISTSSSSENAQSLRLQGKLAHDGGDFQQAAELFSQAAQILWTCATSETRSTTDGDRDEQLEEYATCRLHEALCYLKTEDYQQCLETCSGLLESPPSFTIHGDSHPYSSAVRARALHRRAKAHLGLDRPTLALEDARAAAFLGDAKAVQLYGKLMRQVGGGGGKGNDGATSDTLLQALLSKSPTKYDSPGGDSTAQSAFNPASLLFGGGTDSNLVSTILDSLTAKSGKGGTGASSSLASSVLKSLSKRLDDPTTHTTVATFLQKTTKAQLAQYSSMAGVAIPEPYLERLEAFCQAITARKILWTIKLSKIAIFITQFTRRVLKLLRKYRSLLVCVILLQWTKSAILRPIPIDRSAAKKVAKQELKKALKDNRGKK